MSILEFENNYWKNYNQQICFRHKETKKILESLKIKDFIDVGAGDGFFINYVKDIHITGTALELSDEGYRKCSEKKIDTIQEDVTQKNMKIDKIFHAVTCLDVLEHTFNPEIVIQNMYNLTRKYLIISVPNFNSITARYQTLIGQVPENNTPKKGHCYWFNKKILENILESNGFKIIDWRSNTVKENFFGMKLLLQLKPELFSLSFVITCEKVKII